VNEVFSPFAIVTAYFSMNRAVIPFTLTTTSFFIAYFTTMIAMPLIFVVLKAILHFHWSLKRISSWIKSVTWDVPHLERYRKQENWGDDVEALPILEMQSPTPPVSQVSFIPVSLAGERLSVFPLNLLH
jgi:hypothetical protein